jgi:hypothetical protein
MRRSRHYLAAAALMIAICAFAIPSYADTEYVSGCSGCSGYAFQATLTSTGPNTYSLSYTITNVSGSAADAQSLSLTSFQSGNNVTSFSNFQMSDGNTSAYKVLVGKSNNGSNGNCNSSVSDAMCITTTGLGPLSKITKGNSLTFSFDFMCSNCTALSSWDFLAHGTCDPGSGNCYAISNNGTNTPVPEPSALALYITTLAAMGIVFGWRGRTRVRSRSSGINTCCAR